MAYFIAGLDPAPFAPLFALDHAELEARGARLVTADSAPGFPCRVSLVDAAPGETLLLMNHVSNAAGPFRTAHAIYVRADAQTPARYEDALPPVFAGRTLSLRGFDSRGELRAATLATADDADQKIRAMFADSAIAEIHAHNAAPGCFAARIVRS